VRKSKGKSAKKKQKARDRNPKRVGVLTITTGAQRGGKVVGRSRRAFSEAKAKRNADNPDPPPSYLPKGPIRISKKKSKLTGL
jgi:hypothetical protein